MTNVKSPAAPGIGIRGSQQAQLDADIRGGQVDPNNAPQMMQQLTRLGHALGAAGKIPSSEEMQALHNGLKAVLPDEDTANAALSAFAKSVDEGAYEMSMKVIRNVR
jgi:hypothetical protein